MVTKSATFDANGAVIVIDEVIEVVDEVSSVEVPEGLLRRIPAKARSLIYTVGVLLGVAATVAPAVAALLTGEAQILTMSLGGLALALSNLLAKANVKAA